jgi:cytochrome c oxidase assembly protein subunit 15
LTLAALRDNSVVEMQGSGERQLDGKPVLVWLGFIAVMVWAMVIVGGITRLTGSGLSMVEWRPLMGALPPLDEAEWMRVFARYQESPQYEQVNHWMTLVEFKRIFFWEYLHRVLGRTIGLVTVLPWVYFKLRGRMSAQTARRSLIALFLGGAQGLLGWFMVKSGLVDVPEVSHFRLASHLALAFFVGQWILWILFDLRRPFHGALARESGLRGLAWACIALISLQIIYGAFMAGTRAGWLFSTFPDMNGAYLPGAFMTGGGVLHEFLHSAALIHWTHRFLAYGCVLLCLVFAYRLRFITGSRASDARLASTLVGLCILVQFVLGVLTVMLHVPIWAAVTHQAMAFVALGCTLFGVHCLGSASAEAPADAESRVA